MTNTIFRFIGVYDILIYLFSIFHVFNVTLSELESFFAAKTRKSMYIRPSKDFAGKRTIKNKFICTLDKGIYYCFFRIIFQDLCKNL